MERRRQKAFRQYLAPNSLESTSLVMAELSTIPLERFQAHWDRRLISSVASSGHHCRTSLSTGRTKPMHFQHLPPAPFHSWPTSNHHHHPSYSVLGLWLRGPSTHPLSQPPVVLIFLDFGFWIFSAYSWIGISNHRTLLLNFDFTGHP